MEIETLEGDWGWKVTQRGNESSPNLSSISRDSSLLSDITQEALQVMMTRFC